MCQSVVTGVVKNDLCVGCGICAGLCPQGALQMAWNRYGEYNPIETKPCGKDCGLCQKVCPFADQHENEDTIGKALYGDVPGISHLPETGYFLASYVGYSEEHRPASASGGIVTWILEQLLGQGIVNRVVCVAPTGDHDRLFSFAIFETPEEVRSGAGSAYYPTEMSGVIKQILEVPGRYAVTGLPCLIKAIRLAQQRSKKLDERIAVTIGLVCGQLKSKHFTEYIRSLANIEGKLARVRYRGKDPSHPANDFHFSFITEDGKQSRIFWTQGIAEAWTNRWFTPNACNYCDDVFAECADVACMDAWLPEYLQDSRGTSLVLVRSLLVREVLERGGGSSLDPIPFDRVVQSQAGVLAVKRQHLAYRLYIDGEVAPKKRIAPVKPKNPFLKQENVLKERMRSLSRDLWVSGERDGERFRKAMGPDLKQLNAMRQIAKIITFPVIILRHIWRKVRGINNG